MANPGAIAVPIADPIPNFEAIMNSIAKLSAAADSLTTHIAAGRLTTKQHAAFQTASAALRTKLVAAGG